MTAKQPEFGRVGDRPAFSGGFAATDGLDQGQYGAAEEGEVRAGAAWLRVRGGTMGAWCSRGCAGVADIVEIEHFLDLGEAEADPLAAKDPRHPGPVAVGI